MTKILMLHPWVHDIPSFLKFASLPDSLAENLVWEEDAPEILFCSEWIYYKSAYFDKFRKVYPKVGLKVAFLGEAIDPDWNLFDYGIGFSDAYSDNARFVRLPSPFTMFKSFVKSSVNEITTVEEAAKLFATKERFCNFLYSNPQSNPMRDKLFYEISKYKRVDSLGRHLNNVSTPGTGYSGHSAECTPIKSDYRFSIASENSDFTGYTSEKILTSLEAHTVPIYWGNPNVEDDVNPECFVNAAKFDSFEKLLAEIKRIDTDQALWCKMIAAPWLLPEQATRHEQRTANYIEQMQNLLAGKFQPKAPEGYHIYLYRRNFFDGTFTFDNWKTKLKRWLRVN